MNFRNQFPINIINRYVHVYIFGQFEFDICNWVKRIGVIIGYMSSSQLVKHKVHTSTIHYLLKYEKIERVKRGLYRLSPENLVADEYFTFDYFDAAIAVPEGVFCPMTALSYHDLSTSKPSEFDMAIPPARRDTKLATVSVRFYRFREPYYSYGIQEIQTSTTSIKIYEKEKSVCDAIRLRHIIGDDVAMEALNTYIRMPQKKINKLWQVAKICRVSHIVEPAVKAMTGF